MNVQTGNESRGLHPSSERWLQYYAEARARRRARGPQVTPREVQRRHQNRQLAALVIGCAVVGVLVAVFYIVLTR